MSEVLLSRNQVGATPSNNTYLKLCNSKYVAFDFLHVKKWDLYILYNVHGKFCDIQSLKNI
jgi:hypothetical protein